MAKFMLVAITDDPRAPGGQVQTVRSVPGAYDATFIDTVMAHPSHGQIAVSIMADTGQKDEDGKPIFGPAIQMRPASFEEAFDRWADANVFGPMVNAAADAVYSAQVAAKLAEVERPVIPVTKE
jgi:hypothetical protein